MGAIKSYYFDEIAERDLDRHAWDTQVEVALGYLDGCGQTRMELIVRYSEPELVRFHKDGLWPEVAE